MNSTVDRLFWGLERCTRDVQRRDEILAFRAALLLLAQLGVWLVTSLLGLALLLLPFTNGRLAYTVSEAASAMITIGFAVPQNPAEKRSLSWRHSPRSGPWPCRSVPARALRAPQPPGDLCLALTARAGVPTWRPELLARTHFGLGSGCTSPSVPRPPDDPGPAVPPQRLPVLHPDRSRQALGVRLPDEADPSSGTTLTYEEFVEGVARLKRVGFPIERESEEAWPEFVGWRVNYERAAYAVASAVSAPPALWSGPRRIPATPVPRLRRPDHPPAVERPADSTTPDPRARSGP